MGDFITRKMSATNSREYSAAPDKSATATRNTA